MMKSLCKTLPVLLPLLMLISMPGIAQPLDQPVTEAELKAAFLYNFATYVTWPPEMSVPDQPLTIGVVGAAELADYLEGMARARQINGRNVEVRRIRLRSDFGNLHIVFIAERFTEDARDMLVNALNESTLTVTETDPEDRLPSSVINFEVVDDKIRFDISLTAAATAGLTISSRLLQLALRVIGSAP
jgi:hypothetical protein